MKRLYLLTFLLCLFRQGVAQTLIDGIYYNLNLSNFTAEVTATPNGVAKYSGDITLPSEVTCEDVSYAVTRLGDQCFSRCPDLTSITIPASVTSLGDQCFIFCSALESISVESGNTVYDSRDNCNAIIETTTNTMICGCNNTIIPLSVTGLKRYCFSGCSSLTSITIPASVTSVENQCIIDCSNLESISVESGNTVYDSRDNCNAIIETATNQMISGCNNTIIPLSVSGLKTSCFSGCSGLTSITIPASVTSIDAFPFNGCSNLESISVESGNTVYDSRDNCNAIIETATNQMIRGCKNTIIPETVMSLGNCCFSGCSSLTSITIPEGVTYLASYCFHSCIDLTSITIPASVTGLGAACFSYCSDLTKVQVKATTPPYAVSDIFDNCSALTTIYVPTGCASAYNEAPWNAYTIIDEEMNITASIDGVYYNLDLFNETASVAPVPDGEAAYSGNIEILETVTYNGIVCTVTALDDKSFYGCSDLTAVTIPGSVKSIGQQAFYGCKGLTSISIPASVKSIGVQAFTRCTGLTSVVIPNSVTYIQSGTFYGCTSLATVTIPNTVTSIGQQAFNSCTGLTSLTIPGSVTSMGDYAFRNCSGLTNIFVKSITPPTVSDNLFSGCTSLQTIYVPKGSATVYDTTPWNNYNIVEKAIIASVDGIYYSLNGYAHSAEVTSHPDLYTGSLTIPATIPYEGLTYEVNSIAMDAFELCLDLTELTLSTATPPAADPTIFIDCMSLTTIHIPDGAMAAYNCAPWSDYTLVDAGRERLIQLVADVNNYVTGTSKAAVIPTAEVTRQANKLLDEARADVESLTYDVNTVQRLQQLRDYLATGQFAGAENVDISFNRKSNHTGWQTLYVPFDIAYDAIADDFVVAELNDFHQYDDDSDGTFDRTELEVLLLKSGDVIAHNTPYVIRAKETGTHTISLPGATVYASVNNTLDCSSTKIRYVFHGTYQGVSGADMYANNYYAMSNGSLCKANSSNADLSAFRWYLSMEDRNSTLSKMPAKIKIVCIDDDTTTDISEVEVTSTDENAPIYDLNGRFVGRKDQMHHLPKGVYIINGKKVLR